MIAAFLAGRVVALALILARIDVTALVALELAEAATARPLDATRLALALDMTPVTVVASTG